MKNLIGMSFLTRTTGILLVVSAVYPVSLDRQGFALSALLALLFGTGWFVLCRRSRRISFSLAKTGIGTVLVLALGLRVAVLGLSDLTQISDYADFNRVALSMLQGGAWFDPGRPPGISWLAAVCYHWIGTNILVPLTANLTLQLFGIYITWRAARITFDERIASLSALLLALYPEHIIHANYLSSEPGYFLGVNLGFLLYARAIQSQGWHDSKSHRHHLFAVLAGISFALAQYFRATVPIALGAIVLLEAVRLWKEKERSLRQPALRLGGLTGAFLLGISPIIRHNRHDLGIWSASSYQMSGWSMYLATNPKYLGNWNAEDVAAFDSICTVYPPPPGQNEYLYRDSLAKHLARERFSEYPAAYFGALFFFKPYCLWGDPSGTFWVNQQFEPGSMGRYLSGLWLILYHKCILLAAGWALWRSGRLPVGRKNGNTVFLADIYLTFAWLNTFAFAILGTEGRYHNVLLGWLCWWAAFAIGQKMEK